MYRLTISVTAMLLRSAGCKNQRVLKWKPLYTGCNAFIYHLQVVLPVHHPSHFSHVLINPGSLGCAGHHKAKAETSQIIITTDPHLDQVNEDVEIPHSNVPLQQLLQLYLMGCKGTVTQDVHFLSLCWMLSPCLLYSKCSYFEDRRTKLYHRKIYHSKSTQWQCQRDQDPHVLQC